LPLGCCLLLLVVACWLLLVGRCMGADFYALTCGEWGLSTHRHRPRNENRRLVPRLGVNCEVIAFRLCKYINWIWNMYTCWWIPLQRARAVGTWLASAPRETILVEKWVKLVPQIVCSILWLNILKKTVVRNILKTLFFRRILDGLFLA